MYIGELCFIFITRECGWRFNFYSMATILIVDDNNDMRAEIADLLELAGWSTLSASNGMEGIEAARKYQPDLILCDIFMPVLNGYEAYSQLTTDEKTAQIPFVFLTAADSVEQVVATTAISPDRVLRKPFEARNLIETIERLLS